jgi:hypothetical protein
MATFARVASVVASVGFARLSAFGSCLAGLVALRLASIVSC